jgi:hypothetical protein
VKPAEHPDFFNAPPPPGRSRESAIVLDSEGRFHDRGQPVEHPAMAQAFRTWIDRHPEDDRYILNNGYDWTYFQVQDVPFRVRAAEATQLGIELALDDGSRELLHGPVWLGANGALYVAVKAGRFSARFDRESQAGLGELLLEEPGGFALWSPEGPIPVLEQPPERSPGHDSAPFSAR